MWKARVFLSDYADMFHTHLSRVLHRLNLKTETFYALDLTMEVDQIRVEDGTFQSVL